jgi:hypothetical protein
MSYLRVAAERLRRSTGAVSDVDEREEIRRPHLGVREGNDMPRRSTSTFGVFVAGLIWALSVTTVGVYANSEDGNLYAISQGHRGVFSGPSQRLFLDAVIPGAYTPLSISEDGLIFT